MRRLVTPPDLARFEAGETPSDAFSHADHVLMAHAMLARRTFPDSAVRYSRAIQRMASRAGAPDAYHETMTIAFLAIIAERVAENPKRDAERFAAENPDLFQRGILARHYSEARLESGMARSTFLLPDRSA
ncbi:MAG: hypothetical protein H0X36_06960 [Sphingomonadaceae bacterium]|nr:hypothetical protein [Sphingomonadaceae bacterium]